MRSVAVLAVLALVAVTVAGCSTKDPVRYPNGVPSSSASRSSSSSSSTWPPSSSSTSTGPANATGRAPVGSLKATLNGTSATFEVNGTDADGDALNWTLDFGDGNSTNGTSLPSTQAHNYTLPANTTALNVTARLTLSDGLHNATYDANLTVGGASGPVQTVAGEIPVSNGNCLGATSTTVPAAAFFPDQSDGVSYLGFDVDPASAGHAFTATFTYADGSVGGLVFVDSGGAYVERHVTADDDQTPTALSGTVPAKAARGFLFGCLNEPDPVGVSYTA